ncbi:MAG: hypothetical protein HC869_26645 [Rhodospirillales bacterium]|nr:hypothetical protein [Rhodospirillales bacterium]
MHTPPLPQEGLSAVSSIKNWIVPGLPITQAALLPTNSVAEQKSATRIEMALDLLLIRMEALGLQPGEVKRIDTAVFGDLAAACCACEQKDECELDLAYQSAGTVTQDWEKYCPNAAVLNAMRELPWFGNQSQTRTD